MRKVTDTTPVLAEIPFMPLLMYKKLWFTQKVEQIDIPDLADALSFTTKSDKRRTWIQSKIMSIIVSRRDPKTSWGLHQLPVCHLCLVCTSIISWSSMSSWEGVVDGSILSPSNINTRFCGSSLTLSVYSLITRSNFSSYKKMVNTKTTSLYKITKASHI